MSDVQSSTSDGLDFIDKNEIKNEKHDKQQFRRHVRAGIFLDDLVLMANLHILCLSEN